MVCGPNDAAGTLISPEFSPDGRYLVHIEQSGPTGAGIFVLPLTGEKKPFPIVLPPSPQARIIQHRLSPDGRWLAYSSTAPGREEVYVTHFPSGQGRWQVSQNGGTFPAWRGDTKEIWYVGLDGTMHTVPVNTKSTEFESGPAQTLFPMGYMTPPGKPCGCAPAPQHLLFSPSPGNVPTPPV